MSTTRKEMLQRKQKGKAILPKWKEAIEDAANQKMSLDSFLDLEQTERLRTDFFGKVRDGGYEHRFVTKQGFSDLVAALKTISAQHDGLNVILFHSKDKFIGALRMDGGVVLHELEAIWRVVEEDFCVATSDLNSGLCLEENYYDQSGKHVPEGVLELTTWGEFSFK